MPQYCFTSKSTGKTYTVLRTISNRDNPPAPSEVDESDEGPFSRDLTAEQTHSTDQEYDKPVFSNALGIHPNQIPEATRRFPHHEYAPDGRMILRSHAQRKRVMKELGFFDRDGY